MSQTPNSKARISLVHNPTEQTTSGKRDASKLIFNLMSSKLISRLSPQSVIEKLQNLDATSGVEAETYAAYVETCKQLVWQLGMGKGSLGVVANGRVVGPIKEGDFGSGDFSALEGYELKARTEPVEEAVRSVMPASEQLDRFVFDHSENGWSAHGFGRSSFADLVSMASSIVASLQLPDPSESGLFDAPARPRARSYDVMDGEQTYVVVVVVVT